MLCAMVERRASQSGGGMGVLSVIISLGGVSLKNYYVNSEE